MIDRLQYLKLKNRRIKQTLPVHAATVDQVASAWQLTVADTELDISYPSSQTTLVALGYVYVDGMVTWPCVTMGSICEQDTAVMKMLLY